MGGIKKHFVGPGGINKLFVIAFPMIISQASETVMMFCDRLFLSHLGEAYLSAAMIGGLTSFVFMSFWRGVVGYVNALVAQYYGSGQKDKCALVVVQGAIISVVGYIIVLCTIPIGWFLFSHSHHDPVQLHLETRYFTLLAVGSIFVLIKVNITSFFAGIGRTRIIMIADCAGMIANIPLTYILVFGTRFSSPLGIDGAAYGTIAGMAVSMLIIVWFYLFSDNKKEFPIMNNFRYEWAMFRKLLRYGLPSGVDVFLTVLAFNIVMLQFHSYGREIAAAISITFSWDLVAFLPMFGISIAITSLVGQNLGRGDVFEAERSVYSGLKVAGSYASIMALIFLIFPGQLVNIFLQDPDSASQAIIYDVGRVMLRMVSIYIIFHVGTIVFSGALRGAGDTMWVMFCSIIFYWLFAVIELISIRLLNVAPLSAWGIFIMFPIILCIVYFFRFRGGKWKGITLTMPIDKLISEKFYFDINE